MHNPEFNISIEQIIDLHNSGEYPTTMQLDRITFVTDATGFLETHIAIVQNDGITRRARAPYFRRLRAFYIQCKCNACEIIPN